MLVQLATISHLLLDNLMRSDPMFSEERSLYDAFLILCFRIDDFSGRTRLLRRNVISEKRSQVRCREIENLIASPVQHGFDHVNAEALCLFKIDRWRKRKLMLRHFDAD
jgi:hypothetical protein